MKYNRYYAYYALLEPCEEGDFGVKFPDLPGVIPKGDSLRSNF